MADVFDQFESNYQSSAGTVAADPFDAFEANYAAAQAPAIAEAPVSLIDRVMGGLKGVAKAGTDVIAAPADLLFRGGNAAIDAITGEETDLKGWYPSDFRNQALDFISGGQGDKTTEDVTQLVGNIGTVIAAPSQAKNLASKIPLLSKFAQSGGTGSGLANLLAKTVGYGTEGAAYGALFNAKSDTLGDDVTEGAALNIAIPAAFKLTGNLAKGLLNSASEGARKLELSAYGGMKGNIAKAYERSPEILDEMGKRENPINLAINAFKKDGGGKGSMEGQALLDELATQSGKYAKELGEELFAASSKQTDAIVPEFTFTQNYIDKLAGAAKSEAQVMADDLIAKTINNTDGTLLSLQAEKTALTPLIKETAYGNSANPLKTEILKRIKGDLRRTIEEGYESITGKSGSRIKNLNNELAHRETLAPLFENLRNSGEARDVLRAGIKSLSTTGGVGQTAAAAMIGGGAGGVPLAGLAVVGNMYLQTPQGKRALANGLRSSLVQAPLRGTTQGARLGTPLGRVAGALDDKDVQATQSAFPVAQPSPKATTSLSEQKLLNSSYFKNTSLSNPTQVSPYNFVNTMFKDQNMESKPLVEAVIWQESRGKSNAVSPKGAQGLMQVMPATAKEIAAELGIEKYDLKDPETNRKFGEYYLDKMLKMFDGDEALALAAYNAGPGAVQKWIDKWGADWTVISNELQKRGWYDETVKYVPSILKKKSELVTA